MAFEFDPAKSAANKEKHGIDFEAAQAIWKDDRRINAAVRTQGETRLIAVGVIDGKHWTAVYTMRGEVIRLISVRRSRGYEVENYLDR